MKKLIKNHLLCIILGTLTILLALLLAPFWTSFWDKCPWGDWGKSILKIVIAVLIVCYLVFFLVKKIKQNGKSVIRVLTIVEFVLLALIALGCIFSQFEVIKVGGPCEIFGLILWTRGCVEIFRAYYYRSDSKEVYPIWYLALMIASVTLGTSLFVKPFISEDAILWIFVVFLFLVGALLLYLGIAGKKQVKTSKK